MYLTWLVCVCVCVCLCVCVCVRLLAVKVMLCKGFVIQVSFWSKSHTRLKQTTASSYHHQSCWDKTTGMNTHTHTHTQSVSFQIPYGLCVCVCVCVCAVTVVEKCLLCLANGGQRSEFQKTLLSRATKRESAELLHLSLARTQLLPVLISHLLHNNQVTT